jgi:magnesium chelatase subunit H
MPKHTTAVEPTPLRFVLVTMDSHLSSATARAGKRLARDLPGLELTIHAADEWSANPDALRRCCEGIARADIIVATMLFMEDHFRPLLEALRARRDHCDAMVCAMSASEIMRLTRMGRFCMDGTQGGPLALLKRLRGAKSGQRPAGAGAAQLKMLRRIPRLLRFIPGTAQDVRAYFLTLQYWLAGSEENIAAMVRFLVSRYAAGPRQGLRSAPAAGSPIEYPDVGVYHPRLRNRMSESAKDLPRKGEQGCVGLLLLRSYLLAGNSAHYDGVIGALEARGLRVIPAFAAGLDARPAIERFFFENGAPCIDALLSLTGFSLVGGPAYNDSKSAAAVLGALDVPYVAAHPVEFQTLEQWEKSERGLLPVEATMMVALPELDGATGPTVFGGRSQSGACAQDMVAHPERTARLAARLARLTALRRARRAARKVAIVLFNFPPNAGSVGTAAFLAVFESLFNTLAALSKRGYGVDLPETADALRDRIVGGNAARFGAVANVHVRIPANDHVRREAYLKDIEAHWGPAPGKQLTDGTSIFVLGELFGNVFVGIQPPLGIEGDPMRLLFDKGFAPTHAFSAFYRYLREDFRADALLHFGTHGALEFMPGKQSGMTAACWPDRLIGDVPNIYLYASNNPSEGTLAKRRIGATLVSYLTPPVTNAGLYRGLADLKESIEGWRTGGNADCTLAALVQSQAAALDLAELEPPWAADAAAHIETLRGKVLELEYTLIPCGMHVVGSPLSPAHRVDLLTAMAGAAGGDAARGDPSREVPRQLIQRIVDGQPPAAALADTGLAASENLLALLGALEAADRNLRGNAEIEALLHALDGGYVQPAPGGDLLRTPEVLPSGRNLHGFDPFRIPTAAGMLDGARQAARLIERHTAAGNRYPESVALVLWGTDNLKTGGSPIGQALALLGARPRFDGYGRLAGATLITLEELGRARIDVVMTLSGIFRDLLPLQIRLLAEAAFLAASADEPVEQNFVRKHALRYQATHGCDLETAALRVFGNAESAYGCNVNHLIESGTWDDPDELAETYTRRKGYAYSRSGSAAQRTPLLASILADVDLSYQNLDSVELGITTVDTYFDTLGGISSAVRRAKGAAMPVYIADHTQGAGAVRTLSEQVALEARTRTLNPKWYESMLEHGYEGVRQLEAHVTNTMGWSATTGKVDQWVYREITRTFILDSRMRARLAALNPTSSAKVANRLLEAYERRYWQPDAETLAELKSAGAELEDRLEGIYEGVAA